MALQPTQKMVNAIRSLVVCLLASTSVFGYAAPISIATDTSWLTSNSAPAAGWNTNLAFNTSTWTNANVLTVPGCLTLPTFNCIWYDGQFSATSHAWFRKIFNLNEAVMSASFVGGVDDDVDVYINGVQVLSGHDGSATSFSPLDITAFLVTGANLIAVYAIDNVPVYGQNHAFAALLTVNTQVMTVSLPGALSLVLLGLTGMAVSRRRQRWV